MLKDINKSSCKALEFQQSSDQCMDEFQALIFCENSPDEIGKDLQCQFWRFNKLRILTGPDCNAQGYCNGVHSDKKYDDYGQKVQHLAETAISDLILWSIKHCSLDSSAAKHIHYLWKKSHRGLFPLSTACGYHATYNG